MDTAVIVNTEIVEAFGDFVKSKIARQAIMMEEKNFFIS